MRLTMKASPNRHKQNQTKEQTNQLATDFKTAWLETKRLSVGLSKPVTDINSSAAPGTVPNALPGFMPETIPDTALEIFR